MLCPIFLVAQGCLRFNMASFQKMNDHSRQLKSHTGTLVGELVPLYVSKLRHNYQSLMNVRNPLSFQRVTQAHSFLLPFQGGSVILVPIPKSVVSVGYALI